MDEQSQMDAPVSDTHAECVQRIAELEAKWKRAVADGMNREKEMQREREEFAKYCTVDLIRDLLPIGDALRAAGDDHGTLRKLFDDFLKKHGVEPVGAAGERADYFLHEVVGTRTEEGNDVGVILEVAQMGYTMHGQLLRPARVIVASAPVSS